MVISGFIPEKGDLVWLEFNPQAGHEQQGIDRQFVFLKNYIIKKQDWLCFVQLQVT